LTVDESAAALQVSSKTVLRDWEFARAWLQRELTRERRAWTRAWVRVHRHRL